MLVRIGFDHGFDHTLNNQYVFTLKMQQHARPHKGTSKYVVLVEVWRGTWDPALPEYVSSLIAAGLQFQPGAGWRYKRVADRALAA